MTEHAPYLFPLLICIYGALAHGAILFNDGVYWDGWMIESWQRNRNWAAMKRFFSEVGLPIYYYQHRILSRLGARIFAYRLIAFVSTLLSALAVYLISVHLGYLDPVNSLLLALLYLSYTGYHMNIETNVGLQYTFPTALFYWTVYAALMFQDLVGTAHWSLRLTALAVFFIAFNANSLLVYYFGFLGLKLFAKLDVNDDLLTSLSVEGLRNIDFVVLPFVYWVLKEKLTPRSGFYKDYNRLRFRPLLFVFGSFNAIGSGMEAPITSPIRSAAAANYLWIPVGVFCVAVYVTDRIGLEFPVTSPELAAAMLSLGPVLFAMAALPYLLVGQNFFPGGWATKHHMLFHLPMALIVLGALNLLLPAALILPVAAFVLALNMSYLNWLHLYYIAVTVKERSWLHKLANVDGVKKKSIIYIADDHSIQGDPHIAQSSPTYSFYMFEWLWGERTRVGFPASALHGQRLQRVEIVELIRRSSSEEEMKDVDIDGSHASIVITDGLERSPMRIAVRYLKEKYLPGGDVKKILADAADLKYVEC